MTERKADSPRGNRNTVRIWLVGGVCLALLGLIGIAAYGSVESHRAAHARAQVVHTLQVLRHTQDLENAVLAMESSHRGHLITGDPGFRDRRDAAFRLARDEAVFLQELVADNSAQGRRVAQVLAAVEKRYTVMQDIAALADSDGLEPAREQFNAHGDGSLEPVRRAVQEVIAEEERLLEERSAVSGRNAARLDRVLVYGTGTALLVLAGAGLLLFQQLRRTERVSERLAESSQRLEFTYEASRLGAWDADLASDRLQTSRLMDEMFGRPAGAPPWTGKGLLDALLPEDRELVADALREAQASGKDWGREVRARLPDGRLHWFWISGRALDYVDGQPRRMLGTVSDITERKRTEEELESLFRHSRDMIGIFSFDGRFLRVNPAWTRTLGYAEHELVGRPFIDFVHPDDVAATLETAGAVAEGQDAVLFENRYRTRDGEWRWLLWNSTPSPEHGLTFAVARDITGRKEDERRITELNRELTERSQALETSNRELEAFSYSVSHDLRAPLRHIDGYARMLIEDIGDRLDEEPRRYLRTITDSARRMGQLIDDLLALSRLGRKPVQRETVDMAGLAAEALLEAGKGQAQVEIGTLPPAAGDRALLKQVWINLLSNAVKYSAPRGADAKITVSGETLPDGRVAYTVADNGVGFDMRYAGKLFGVFQRLHAQDHFEGTGVGLAISQRVVARHGGSIGAEAEPDRGARFRFELPAAQEPAP